MTPDDQKTAPSNADKTKSPFVGKSGPRPNPDPDAKPESQGVTTILPDGKTEVIGAVAWWYDEADDWRITGRSLWTGNYLWDGAPMASTARVWGTALLFVDSKNPNEPPSVGVRSIAPSEPALQSSVTLVVKVTKRLFSTELITLAVSTNAVTVPPVVTGIIVVCWFDTTAVSIVVVV